MRGLFQTIALASYALLGVLVMLYGTEEDLDKVQMGIVACLYAFFGCWLVYFFSRGDK